MGRLMISTLSLTKRLFLTVIVLRIHPGPLSSLAPGLSATISRGGSSRFISIIRGAVCYHHYEAAKSITKFDELEDGGLNIRLEKVFKRGLKGEGRK